MNINPADVPLLLPFHAPPPGITSNFTHPPSLAPRITAATITCLFLSITFVSLRFYTRIRLPPPLGWDDYTSLLALLLMIPASAAVLLQGIHYNGVHAYDIRMTDWLPNATPFAIWAVIGYLLYMAAFGIIKISICLLYLRLFPFTLRKSRIAVYVVMVVVTGYVVGGELSIVLSCSPVDKLWRPYVPGVCRIQPWPHSFGQAVLNLATDMALLIIPVPMVWRMRLPLGQRLGIMAAFALGMIVYAVSILRIAVFLQPDKAVTDPTWQNGYMALLSVVELNLTLICSCTPALRRLVLHLFPSLHAAQPSEASLTFGALEASDGDDYDDEIDAKKARGRQRRLSSSATVVNGGDAAGERPSRRRLSSSATMVGEEECDVEKPPCLPDGRCVECGLRRKTMDLGREKEKPGKGEKEREIDLEMGGGPHPGTKFV